MSTVNADIDEQTKRRAEAVLGPAGFTTSDAINLMFVHFFPPGSTSLPGWLVDANRSVEEELTASMAMFRKNITGVDSILYISLKFPRHKPRIKVAIDATARLDPFGDNASVAIADGEHLDGTRMPPWLRKQVEWFLELNRDTLLEYWEGRLDTDQLRERLLANKAKVEAGRS